MNDKTSDKPSVFAGNRIAALVPTDLEQLHRLAIYATAMSGGDTSDKRRVALTAGVMQLGMEHGLPPMTAVQVIDVIPKRERVDGQYVQTGCKIGLNAQAQRALCQKSPVCAEFSVEVLRDANNKIAGARAIGKRADTGQTLKIDVHIQDFRHLTHDNQGRPKQNSPWHLTPDDMLVARATTKLARRLFADVVTGLVDVTDAVVDATPSTTVDLTATEFADELAGFAKPILADDELLPAQSTADTDDTASTDSVDEAAAAATELAAKPNPFD